MRTRTGRAALNLFGSACADRPLAEGARRRAVGAQPSCRYLLPQPAFHRRNLHFQKPTSRSFGPTSTGRAFLGQVTWKGLTRTDPENLLQQPPNQSVVGESALSFNTWGFITKIRSGAAASQRRPGLNLSVY